MQRCCQPAPRMEPWGPCPETAGRVGPPASTRRSGKPTSFCATASVGHVRPIRRTTPTASARFHSGQSDESIYLRFFAPIRELSDRDVYRFTHVDNVDRVALVMTVRGAIIGIGRWDRIDRRSAEVAFNISRPLPGQGHRLGPARAPRRHRAGARRRAVHRRGPPAEPPMLNVFKEAGYAVHHHFEDGVVEVSFDIRPTEQSNAVRVAREHRAESVSMHGLLHPASIAVIGASRRAASIGSRFLAQHPRGRVCRSGLRGEQRGPRSAGTSRLREGRRDPRARRPRRRRRARRTTCSTSSTSAPRRACATCSSPRPGSPRAAPTAPSARSSCAAAPGRTGCASSGRTRSG